MAKRQKSSPKLRRSCGAMAAHMALLEQYPAFRANQMRLEGGPTSDRRDRGIDLKKAKIVTIKTVVNVVYNTDEQNISQAQIASQFKAMNKDFRATQSRQVRYAGAMARARHGLAHPVQAGEGHAHQDDADRLHLRRPGEEAIDRRHRAVSAEHAPEPVGLPRSPAVCSATRSSPAGRRRPTASSSTTTPSARSARRRIPSTKAAPRRTRSATTSTCGTSGATRPTAAARTWSPTRRTAPARIRGMPSWPVVTCNNGPNGDMFMNYMDYTDDAGMFMFTSQQVLRMRTALETMRTGLM